MGGGECLLLQAQAQSILCYTYPMWPIRITKETPLAQRVHTTLAYGTIDDFRSLCKELGTQKVAEIFQTPAPGIYSKARFGLYRAYFGLFNLKPEHYVKHI